MLACAMGALRGASAPSIFLTSSPRPGPDLPLRFAVHCINMCGVLYDTPRKDVDRIEWSKTLRRLNAHESKRCRGPAAGVSAAAATSAKAKAKSAARGTTPAPRSAVAADVTTAGAPHARPKSRRAGINSASSRADAEWAVIGSIEQLLRDGPPRCHDPMIQFLQSADATVTGMAHDRRPLMGSMSGIASAPARWRTSWPPPALVADQRKTSWARLSETRALIQTSSWGSLTTGGPSDDRRMKRHASAGSIGSLHTRRTPSGRKLDRHMSAGSLRGTGNSSATSDGSILSRNSSAGSGNSGNSWAGIASGVYSRRSSGSSACSAGSAAVPVDTSQSSLQMDFLLTQQPGGGPINPNTAECALGTGSASAAAGGERREANRRRHGSLADLASESERLRRMDFSAQAGARADRERRESRHMAVNMEEHERFRRLGLSHAAEMEGEEERWRRSAFASFAVESERHRRLEENRAYEAAAAQHRRWAQREAQRAAEIERRRRMRAHVKSGGVSEEQDRTVKRARILHRELSSDRLVPRLVGLLPSRITSGGGGGGGGDALPQLRGPQSWGGLGGAVQPSSFGPRHPHPGATRRDAVRGAAASAAERIGGGRIGGEVWGGDEGDGMDLDEP